MKNIKVKIGRKYLTQCGEVVECYKIDRSKTYPYGIGDFWYDEQLRAPLGGGKFNDSYEIIAAYKEPVGKDTERKPKKLKIEWGKRYVTRSGTVVICTQVDGGGMFYCRDEKDTLACYAIGDTTCMNNGSGYDIVAAYKKPSKQPAPTVDVPSEVPAPEEPEYPALCWRPANGIVAVFHTEHLGYLVLLPRGAEIPLFIPPCTDTSIWERITPEKLYELLNEDIKNGRN